MLIVRISLALKKKFNKSLVPLWIEIFHSNLLCPLIYSCKLIRRIVISLQNQILVRFLWWHDGWKRKRVSLLICYLFAEKISRRKVGNDAQLIHYRLHKLRKKKKKRKLKREIYHHLIFPVRDNKKRKCGDTFISPRVSALSRSTSYRTNFPMSIARLCYNIPKRLFFLRCLYIAKHAIVTTVVIKTTMTVPNIPACILNAAFVSPP